MKKFKNNFFVVISLLSFLSFSLRTFACPCGCGSQRPLSFYPGERYKFQSSIKLTRFSDFSYVSSRKEFSSFKKARALKSFTFAFNAYELDFALNFGVSSNYHPDEGTHTSFSDPSVSLAKTFWYPVASFLNLESLNFSLAYKPSLTKSMKDNLESVHYLDAHGSGAGEALLSSELSFVYLHYHLGLGSSLIYKKPLEIRTDSSSSLFEAGLTSQTSISLAYNWIGRGTLSLKEEYEFSQADKLDKEKILGSESQKLRTSLSYQMQAGIKKTLGFTVEEEGYFFTLENGLPNYSMSFSYMQAV